MPRRAIDTATLKMKLRAMYNEVELLEILDIDADMILERFSDLLEYRYDELVSDLEEEGYEDEDDEEFEDPYTKIDEEH